MAVKHKTEIEKWDVNDLVHTGSTMLNLACSGHAAGGFKKGTAVSLIGDSHTGKTVLALSCLAEAALDGDFDDYRLIYDDTEWANAFDMEEMFGGELMNRIEPPNATDGVAEHSKTVEDFHVNIMDAIKEGEPFIYVLDSFDAISSEQDDEKAEEFYKARKSGKDVSGSYGMAKPKKASEILRHICCALAKTKSILIIISQTRDNINAGLFGPKKTRSGGNAIKFYSTHEIWLGHKGNIKRKERVVGSTVKAKVSKSKLTGKKREVEFVVEDGYGVDDLRSVVDFLIAEKAITKTGKKVVVEVDGQTIEGLTHTIYQKIEEAGVEEEIKQMAQDKWDEIEEGLKVQGRKKRFG